jgi:biopolymer transport protein ExbD
MGEEIELDLTPMMSMFLILLPFLVSMAVLTHLTTLQFSLPPNVNAGMAARSDEKPAVKLTIVVAPDYLAVTHGDAMLDSIPAVGATFDLDRLMVSLKRYKRELSLNDELVVASRDNIRLKSLVPVMDCCKIAGFGKIGLSNATEDPEAGL